MTFPWTLRPFVREIAADIAANPKWHLNPKENSIFIVDASHPVCLLASDISLDWTTARIKTPVEIPLSTREWWTILRAVKLRYAGGVQ